MIGTNALCLVFMLRISSRFREASRLRFWMKLFLEEGTRGCLSRLTGSIFVLIRVNLLVSLNLLEKTAPGSDLVFRPYQTLFEDGCNPKRWHVEICITDSGHKS